MISLTDTEQNWPNGTFVNLPEILLPETIGSLGVVLADIRDMTQHGLPAISDSEILQIAIRKAVNELSTPVLPSQLRGMSLDEARAFRTGSLEGKMSTAIMYLLGALNRMPSELETVIGEMESGQ